VSSWLREAKKLASTASEAKKLASTASEDGPNENKHRASKASEDGAKQSLRFRFALCSRSDHQDSLRSSLLFVGGLSQTASHHPSGTKCPAVAGTLSLTVQLLAGVPALF